MELKILRSFVAVAKHLSFSKAAKELHTVQPAISRHITSLENELGVKLFFRTSREVVLTAAGEQMLTDAMRLIAQTEQTKLAVQQAASGKIGNIAIGYLAGASLSFIPRLIRSFRKSNPNIDIELIEMTVSKQLEALTNRQIDISFSRPLPATMQEDFNSEHIYSDKLVAVVNQEHPLATASMIDLQQLQHDPFVLFAREEAVDLFDSVIKYCQLAGFSPFIQSQPNQMQTVLIQVACGLGVSIAPYAIKDLRSDDCVFIPIRGIEPDMPLNMTYRQHQTSPAAALFVTLVKEEIAAIRKHMA